MFRDPVTAPLTAIFSSATIGLIKAIYENKHLVTEKDISDLAYLLAIEALKASGQLHTFVGQNLLIGGVVCAAASLLAALIFAKESHPENASALDKHGPFGIALASLAGFSALTLFGAYKIGQGSGEQLMSELSLALSSKK